MKVLFSSICLAAFLLMTSQSLDASPLTPAETMQITVNKVLEVLKDPQLKGDAHVNTKKERLWTIVDSVFDYERLSRNVLGLHWRNSTSEQQKEFTHLFSRLLGNTYMDRILSYGNEKITITKEMQLSESIAEVQTSISSEKGTEIPLFYRLFVENGTWRVYDIIIEGVSLTGNYRSQFKNFLSKKSMKQLLQVLRKKTENHL